MDRRTLLRASVAGALASATAITGGTAARGLRTGQAPATSGGRIRQSVCRWCYPKLSVAELSATAKEIGLASVELLDPKDLQTVADAGLVCAMVNSHPLFLGLAHPDQQESCLAKVREGIEAAAAFGFPNVITFSGNRRGMPDDVGLENCARALKKVVGHAEEKGVTICMELLNSKVDHPDHMCDRTAWGVELVERVGSERFKLLYDIYHMQIMEGDVIRTLREHHEAIGHYHTAGNPGRHELHGDQELNYPAIVRAIVDTGYQGYVGQEFIPTADDPLESLRAAVRLCDV